MPTSYRAGKWKTPSTGPGLGVEGVQCGLILHLPFLPHLLMSISGVSPERKPEGAPSDVLDLHEAPAAWDSPHRAEMDLFSDDVIGKGCSSPTKQWPFFNQQSWSHRGIYPKPLHFHEVLFSSRESDGLQDVQRSPMAHTAALRASQELGVRHMCQALCLWHQPHFCCYSNKKLPAELLQGWLKVSGSPLPSASP